MAEVCYVLEGLCQVTREDIISNFRKLDNDVIILNADVLLRELEIFGDISKFDFVEDGETCFEPQFHNQRYS